MSSKLVRIFDSKYLKSLTLVDLQCWPATYAMLCYLYKRVSGEAQNPDKI